MLQHINRITGTFGPNFPEYMEFSIRTEPVCITFCCLGSCSIIAHVGIYGGGGYPLASLFANAIIALIVIISLHLINHGERI
jgi:hypothetical protein